MKYTLLKNKVTGERSVRVAGGGVVHERDNPSEYNRLRKLALRNMWARQKDDAMRSLGLTKVRGAVSGKVYWE